MIYGYCRISRKTQDIERQVRNIISIYPTAKIYKEAYTGTKVVGRTEWLKIYKYAVSGDTIVFDSVSRMSRRESHHWKRWHLRHFGSFRSWKINLGSLLERIGILWRRIDLFPRPVMELIHPSHQSKRAKKDGDDFSFAVQSGWPIVCSNVAYRQNIGCFYSC